MDRMVSFQSCLLLIPRTAINVGDEGGFAAEIATVDKCLELIMGAVKTSGHEGKVKIGLDVAASGTLIACTFYSRFQSSSSLGQDMI